MYFLIEHTNTYDSYDDNWTEKVIDYSEDKNVLESKAISYTEAYEQELDFVINFVEPYIEKYKIQLEAEWKIYCIPFKHLNRPKAKLREREILEEKFTEEFWHNTQGDQFIKYLHDSNDLLNENIRLVKRYYEIKELEKSVNEYVLSPELEKFCEI